MYGVSGCMGVGVCEWVRACMGAYERLCMGARVPGHTDAWARGCVGARVHGHTGARMHGRLGGMGAGCACGYMGACVRARVHGCTSA